MAKNFGNPFCTSGILIGLVFVVTGCSTTYTKSNFKDSPSQKGKPYSGTKFNLSLWNSRIIPPLEAPATGSKIPISFIELLIDLPFTLVADTLYLPIDLSSDPPSKKSPNVRHSPF